MRILIFDISQDARDVIRRGISFTLPMTDILETNTPNETLLYVTNKSFDLLILDMDHMEGNLIPIVKKAKQNNPDVMIIVLTLFPNDKVKEKLLNNGITNYYGRLEDFNLLLDTLHSIALKLVKMNPDIGNGNFYKINSATN